ncbi:hypothetical protein BDZ89DRAFT_455936 [Hymenopellis radicata]|nr:hypothetical protein BDZ89DRAFT_455936 [Hymenopellis radicata]
MTMLEHPNYVELQPLALRGCDEHRRSPIRDWYIWQPRLTIGDWLCMDTGEYYPRLYIDTQSDLNWDDSSARRFIMRFWIDRRCRMDAINIIPKVEGLRGVR